MLTTPTPIVVVAFDDTPYLRPPWNAFLKRFPTELDYVIEYTLCKIPAVHLNIIDNFIGELRYDYLEAFESGPYKGKIETPLGLVDDPNLDAEVTMFFEIINSMMMQLNPALKFAFDTQPRASMFSHFTLHGRVHGALLIQLHYELIEDFYATGKY